MTASQSREPCRAHTQPFRPRTGNATLFSQSARVREGSEPSRSVSGVSAAGLRKSENVGGREKPASMRIMDTDTGKFVWLGDPGSKRYAILSHVWSRSRSGEQSYHQVNGLWRRAVERANQAERINGQKVKPSILDDPGLSSKIRGACKIARRHGYRYLWIDSCCINQASSAELSEAINSMFEWYSKAAICYAYLEDVQPTATQSGTISEPIETLMRKSKWHTRGWTLQELVAPKHLLFLTRNWSIIGSKSSMAALLEDITGVDVAILIGSSTLDSISVARRMSWASQRKTSRIEDEAYSLLGIFGIYMPTIYGEGRNAFVRLQQEIMKTIPDQSIFAWGPRYVPGEGWLSLDGSEPSSNAQGRASLGKSLMNNSYAVSPLPWGLLANSPGAFIGCEDVVTVSEEDFMTPIPTFPQPLHRLPDLHCSFTPQGARIDLFCLTSSASSFPDSDDDIVIALLRCRTSRNEPIGLILVPSVPTSSSIGNRSSHADSGGRHSSAPQAVTGSLDIERRIIIVPPALRGSGWLDSPSATSSLSVSLRTLDIKPIVDMLAKPRPSAADAVPLEAYLREVMVRVEPWCRDTLREAGWMLSPVRSEPWKDSIRTSASAMHFTIHSTGTNNLKGSQTKQGTEIRLSLRWTQEVSPFGQFPVVITASVESTIFHWQIGPPIECKSITVPCINEERGVASVKILISDIVTSPSDTVFVEFLLPVGPEWNMPSFFVHRLRVTAQARVDATLSITHPRRYTLWHAIELTKPASYQTPSSLRGPIVPIPELVWIEAEIDSIPPPMIDQKFAVFPQLNPLTIGSPPSRVLSAPGSPGSSTLADSYASEHSKNKLHKGRRRGFDLGAWLRNWFG
ncbi:HET-domain-containing protein [Trametes sanguinea]|nr:HET-domain-containing protein [Trametes sanguinea]